MCNPNNKIACNYSQSISKLSVTILLLSISVTTFSGIAYKNDFDTGHKDNRALLDQPRDSFECSNPKRWFACCKNDNWGGNKRQWVRVALNWGSVCQDVNSSIARDCTIRGTSVFQQTNTDRIWCKSKPNLKEWSY